MATRMELMPKAHMQRAIKRMAYQIIEDHKGAAPIQIYGIHTRGYSLAQTLVDALAPISTQPIELFRIENTPIVPNRNAYVVVVDDVLFSGNTMLNAIKLLTQHHVPIVLRVAVLVDRGHRQVPIQPDFTGLVSPTKFNEHVEVTLEAVVLQRD